MKKIIICTLLAGVLTGCFNKVEKENIIAKVGKTIYSVEDINDRIGSLDPNLKEFFDKKENKVKLLDQIIEEEVIYQLAKKDGLQRNKEFRENIEDIRRQALINFYIQEKVDKSAQVTDEEISAFYTENKDSFSEYEARNLSHILVDTKSQATKILGEFKAGAKFETLAQKYSKDNSKARGGQLGWVRKGDLVPEFGNVAFTMKTKNEVSDVVKTEFGYHIIRYNDSQSVPARDLAAVSNEISEKLLKDKKVKMFNDLLANGKESVKIERNIDNL